MFRSIILRREVIIPMKLKKSAYSYVMMLGHLCADLGTGALPAILPFLIAEKGITYTAAAGLTFALSSIGSLIQPIFGSMADKTTRPWLMSLGVFMAGLGISMLGFLDSYPAMFIAVAFTGIGSSLFHPDGGRMANYVSGEKKGKGISLFSVGGNMGGACGPMLVVFGLTLFGMKGTFIMAIPATLMAIFLLSQSNRFAEFAAEGTKATAAAKAAGQKDDWKSFGKLTGVIFLRSTISMGLSTFIPLFWVAILAQSETVSGTTTTILSLSGAVATLIGGRLADRYGFNKTIRSGLVLMIPCFIAVVLSRNIYLSTLMLIPTSMFLNFAFSPSVALGQKFVPNHIGLASGITMGLASSFGGVISPLLGKVGDNFGLPTVMWILVGLTVIGAAASFTVPDAPPTVHAEEPAKA